MMQNFNNTEGSGYIKITNMGGFVAAFELIYTFDGKRESFKTDNILIGGVRKKDIPLGATEIYIKVIVANMGGNWVTIYNNNFENSNAIIDLELYGTMWNPTYYVIQETEKVENLIKVFNNGGFITNFKIDYYYKRREYTIIIPSFYLGMVRKVMLPPNAINIKVYVEIDAIGWGYWWNAYKESFKMPLNLTITLSGSYWYPGIDVQKE